MQNYDDTIDLIAEQLLTIDESAKMHLGCTTRGDQLLYEMNFPTVGELLANSVIK